MIITFGLVFLIIFLVSLLIVLYSKKGVEILRYGFVAIIFLILLIDLFNR